MSNHYVIFVHLKLVKNNLLSEKEFLGICPLKLNTKVEKWALFLC